MTVVTLLSLITALIKKNVSADNQQTIPIDEKPLYDNNNNNLIFILSKIHVNMIKCALHESKLSTLISYPK